MILHIALLDKFIPPYIDFVTDKFSEQKHFFWLGKPSKIYVVNDKECIYQVRSGLWGQFKGLFKLFKMIIRAEKIIIHSLFGTQIMALLVLMPWVHSRCYWVLWGGDYLSRNYEKRNLVFWVKELLRKTLIPRIGHLVTYIPGSIDIVRDWYNAKGTFHECLAYTSNVYNGELQSAPLNDGRMRVLVGNSATPTNNHIDTFQRIEPFFEENVMIYCPLSYGDKSYAEKVISEGKKLFGDNFVPLTDFIPPDKYKNLMTKIDIVIFNHNRHQAMGNIINFLGMGKKVYLRKSVASWPFLTNLGLVVFDIDSFNGFSSASPFVTNHQIVKDYFSFEKLEKQWSRIFNEE